MREGHPYRPFITPQFEEFRPRLAAQELDRIVAVMPRIKDEEAEETVEIFRGISKVNPFYNPQIVPLANGAALLWFTEEGLGRRAHRLTVSETAEVTYYRTSFDTDFQAIPAPDVNLSGFEEISQNNDAVFGLLCMESSTQLAWERAANGTA